MFLRLFSVSSFAAAQVVLMYGYVQFTQRLIKGIRATRYICISAPSYPFPPIDIITQKLNPSRVVIERCQQYFARQLGATWDDLKTGKSFDGAGPDLLLFYDETDRMVSHHEGDKIFAHCPGATLLKTSAYGHRRILIAPELAAQVITFLAMPVG